MKTLLRMSLAAAAVLCLLSAGAQTPAGDAVSDFDYAVDVVERAYAGYPDKTAGREAEYAALKGRLQSEISGDRDVYDAIAEYLGWFDDSHLQTPGAEVLMGTSTAGIAHAAITATILDLPMGYVRSGSKDHGRGNRIEGKLEQGQKVVVIEDLISTGGSCIEVVNALREAGAEVLGVASIFTYGMKKGLERLKEAGVVNYSLSNLDALVEVAAEEGYIEPGDKARLLKFRDNPSDESWMDK